MFLVLVLLIFLSAILLSPCVDAFTSSVPTRTNLAPRWQHFLAAAAAEEDDLPPLPPPSGPGMERAWRYAKKPLLSLGAQKGATLKHGNSLRELLQQHVLVKVKIQLLLTSASTEADIHPAILAVYAQLRDYAVQSGAPPDLELLQVRPSERTILIGRPGTRAQIEQGTFPPRSDVPPL